MPIFLTFSKKSHCQGRKYQQPSFKPLSQKTRGEEEHSLTLKKHDVFVNSKNPRFTKKKGKKPLRKPCLNHHRPQRQRQRKGSSSSLYFHSPNTVSCTPSAPNRLAIYSPSFVTCPTLANTSHTHPTNQDTPMHVP